MTGKSAFEKAWLPRIGETGSAKLRNLRTATWFAMVAPVFAFVAGILLSGKAGGVGLGFGVLFAAGATASVVYFITAILLLGSALSEWFAVDRIRFPPRMTPTSFDRWREKKGYLTPTERAVVRAQ